jgi:hypothetical protein
MERRTSGSVRERVCVCMCVCANCLGEPGEEGNRDSDRNGQLPDQVRPRKGEVKSAYVCVRGGMTS